MLISFPLSLALLAAPFSVSAQAAEPATPASTVMAQALPSAGPTQHLLRVIQVKHTRPPSADESQAEIDQLQVELQVYRTSDGVLLQRLWTAFGPDDADSGRAHMAFRDLNADGYQDLTFQTSAPGAIGETPLYDVFLWEPRTQQFVFDETLTQSGPLPDRKTN